MSRLVAVIVLSVALTACKEVDVTDPKVRDAALAINAEFQRQYVKALRELGTRHFDVDAAVASNAMHATLTQLGFREKNRDETVYLNMVGPAPLPLDNTEWERVRVEDEPVLQRLASEHLGVKGRFATLQPSGLNIEIFCTFVPAGTGVDVTMTMRMREVAPPPPESILPRRQYPPPAAFRMGIRKIWRTFEQQALPLARMSAST
jgi:hypothetical protein